jgi:hypothetical protein
MLGVGLFSVFFFEADFVLVGQLLGRFEVPQILIILGVQLFGHCRPTLRTHLPIKIMFLFDNGHARKHLL